MVSIKLGFNNCSISSCWARCFSKYYKGFIFIHENTFIYVYMGYFT